MMGGKCQICGYFILDIQIEMMRYEDTMLCPNCGKDEIKNFYPYEIFKEVPIEKHIEAKTVYNKTWLRLHGDGLEEVQG